LKPFTQVRGRAVALEGRNVDTDQIIPARFLKKNRAAGYGEYLFHDLRIDAATQKPTSFVLNQDVFKDATVLVADHNFGCGSSREGAVYTLADFGFRAVIAPSFGDIFYSNCLKNGLLPIRLDAQILADLRQLITHTADTTGQTLQIDLDLATKTVCWPGLNQAIQFDIDPFWRECLLKGVDEVSLTLSYQNEIDAFEQKHHAQRPWLIA
jgi:3-isopropylmalate/(R)-2-methylmalate dehydratase small subunit